jgi:hypothetical protein
MCARRLLARPLVSGTAAGFLKEVAADVLGEGFQSV